MKKPGKGNERKKAKRERKARERQEEDQWGRLFGYDDSLSFLAGFTPGGAPYGITWEEQRRIDAMEENASRQEEGWYMDPVRLPDSPTEEELRAYYGTEETMHGCSEEDDFDLPF